MRKLAILLTMLCAVVGLGLYATSSGFSSPWAPTREATPTAGEEASSTAFVPEPDRWYRISVAGNDARTGRVWEVYRTSGYESFLTDAQRTACRASEGVNRLITNAPQAKPNDWQLFKFIKGSGDNAGKYAILSKATGKYLSNQGSGTGLAIRYDFKSDKPVYGFWLHTNVKADGKYQSRICVSDPAIAGIPLMLNGAGEGQGFAVNSYNGDQADNGQLYTFTEVVEETFKYPLSEGTKTEKTRWESIKFGVRPIQLILSSAGAIDQHSSDKILAINPNGTITFATDDGYYISKLIIGATKSSTSANTLSINGGEAINVTANYGRNNAVDIEYINTNPDQDITVAAGPTANASIAFFKIQVQLTRKPGAETITFPLSLSSVDHNAEKFNTGTTWYRMYLRNNKNKFVRYDAGSFAYVGESPEGGITPGDLWCMEPTEDGMRFYNYGAGAEKIVSGTTSTMAMEPIFESTNDKWSEWIVYAGNSTSDPDPYYYVRARYGTGNSNLFWHDINGSFGYWNNASAATDGGSQIRFIEYTGDMPTLPEVTYPVVVTEDEAMTRTDRYTGSVGISVGGQDQTIYPLQSPTEKKIYWNFADAEGVTPTILKASPGDEVNFNIDYSGNAMHKVVYIDWDKDGFNGAAHTSFVGYPEGIAKKASGDMVFGINKSQTHPAYTIPDNIPLGKYRIRFKVDWDGNANGVNATTMPAGNPGNADGSNRITANGGIIVDAILEIVEPIVDEFEPDPDKWYRLTVFGSNRSGRSLEAYHVDIEPTPVAAANAAAGRLLSNDPTSSFNDYQLFRFEKDENTGRFAIYNKGIRAYLNTSDLTGNAGSTRFDFSSSTPVYGFYISGTQTCGDGQKAAQIHLTNPTGSDHKFMQCGAAAQGYAINFATNTSDAADSHIFIFSEMEDNRVAVVSTISDFPQSLYDSDGGSYRNGVTTNVTADAPVRVRLAAPSAVGWSGKTGRTVIMADANKEITLEPFSAPAGYYISKVIINCSAHNAASSLSINGNNPVEVTNNASAATTLVSATAASPDQVWKITTGANPVFIWDLTVEFSRPFSADVRKAQTAERLRKLGNLTSLGFDSEEAELRAKAVEAHEFADNASADDIIEWCADQFIDYVKTADYGDDNAYFHINNNSHVGSLAVDRSGVADLYDPMSIYALWCFYPNPDAGTIKLYNPKSDKWLAVEGANVTVVDTRADATPLYIGGSAGKDIAIFTTSAADINNAVVASSATTLGMAAATTNLSGPDHWVLTALTDADCKEVLDVTRDIVLGDLDVYEKVPALWSSESLEQVRQEVDQVTQPDDLSLANLFNEGQGWAAYEADLESAMAGIKEKCMGISFYLTQKTKSDAAPIRIISVNSANTVTRVAALDKTCIFSIDQVNTEGQVKIAYTNADGVKKYLARSGNDYVANDQGIWFEIVVSPRNTNGAYTTNEVSLLDPHGGFINRNGVDGFGLQSYGYDDDGSRWFVTAMNAEQAAADIETYREAAIAKLEQLRDVPFFWTADNMNAAIEEVKAVTVSAAGLSPAAALDAVLEAQDQFNKIIVEARKTIAHVKFAAYNGSGSTFGYLSSRQDGMNEADTSSGTFFLTQQSEITGKTAEWELVVADPEVPTFYIQGPDANDNTCYFKPRPGGNNQSWQLTRNQAEAGQFKVLAVGATGKVGFMSYPTDNEALSYIHNARWNGRTNDLVRWSVDGEFSQWTIMGLEAEALQEQLNLDIAAAKGQLDQMRRLPAIWPADLVDEAETKITDFTIEKDDTNPLNSYIKYRSQIDKIISDVNSQVDNAIVYFTNVANQGIMAVGDAHGNNPERLFRQTDKVLTNGNFFKLIPDGTGFKLFNEYYDRYIAGNPGRDNAQWQTTATETDAATLYFDAAFCSATNQTGISTVATSGASGNYFIHANNGDPVRWNGNNDPSRWIVASASQSDIDAAKYIGWLEDAKSASPWGAYSLSEGVKALKSAVAGGNVTPEQIENLYNSTVETVEQTIASAAQDAEVIISHHPSGHILVASDAELHKREDNRTGAALSNNTFEPSWRWKLVAKEGTPDKFHIMSMTSDEENVAYVSSFEKGAQEHIMGKMTTTEDEKLAAVISLREGRLVFEDRDTEPALQTLAEGDGETATEPEHEYWVIGLYQPNTLMPEPSTPDAPKLYYIRNVAKMRETEAKRQRQYLTAGGSNNGSDLRLYQNPQAASLWYVTEEGEGTYKIRNAYYPDVMIQSPNKVATDPLNAATSLYIKECTTVQAARGVGLYISTTSNLSGSTCLDRGGFNADTDATYDGLSGGYSPRNGDYLGTAWVFTPVSENDEVAYFEQAKETGYNAAMEMIEYFRMANPWCWDVFDRAAGEVGATFSPSGSFGEALKELDDSKALNDMKTDFSSALAKELEGKTFIINSVARRENLPKVPTARIGVNSTGIVAVKEGATDQNDAFTFMPSEKDGYFYIYNGEGKFIGASGSSRFMVDNIEDAGRFTLEIRFNKSGSNLNNYWTCIKQDNGQYLKVDASGAGLMSSAGDNNSNATGFEFEIYHPAPSGIEDVTTDSAAFKPVLNGEAQLYDLRGARINPANAAPGIYILRTGNEAIKIRIR